MSYTSTRIAASTAAVADRIVASANMKVGAYTIANASAVWEGGFKVTLTHTAVNAADTLGTVAIVGKDLFNNTITETITPVDGQAVTGTKIFRSITSATGAGWVIGGGNDTITIGVAADSYPAIGGGILHNVVINSAAAAAVTISDSSGTIATFESSAVEGSYLFDVAWSGFLKIATTSTNDIVVVHTSGVPSTYAMA